MGHSLSFLPGSPALFIFQSPEIIALYVLSRTFSGNPWGREGGVCLLNLNQHQKFLHFFVTFKKMSCLFPASIYLKAFSVFFFKINFYVLF